MKQIITTGIVLSRTDFQEADRILSILTPDNGKIKTIAKGVRKARSKLAGGIELFSVSDITFAPGRGEFATLISTRLREHYGNIVKDINRTMFGYEILKRLNKLIEDNAESEYFDLLEATLVGLDDLELQQELTELWFTMQLLNITGHTPNLMTDSDNKTLTLGKHYLFDFDTMSFREQNNGPFTSNHIKLLRLCMGTDNPTKLKQVTDAGDYLAESLQLARTILKFYLHA